MPMIKPITDEMAIAAARELARCAEERGLHEEYIIPSMDEWEVFPREAAAVGVKAQEQGVARLQLSFDELLRKAEDTIRQSREMTQFLMEKGLIPPVPGSGG